ncbi:DUF421 domain-containing protein [Weissella hellenica]|uniref:DUF421 domain-containing protein n=1 Tax=Weissella hellenica TaxID=46256 RepID=A0A4Y4G2K5_WEIHE|nr:DUF421 domain-containing protein [Weissella hellenica]NKY67413.1 DUF421 domain-containing protein [Weissella hellenica]GED36469.1 DUF421 domain-containing protein [Weissella hellenica]SCC07307.1 Uncharacterized membrane protein YcaP, DUF421 family [Weissella hellenica]
MFSYSDVLLKLIIGFIFITLLIKFSGKGSLALTSPLDQVQNYVLGGIIGGILYNQVISIAQYVVVLTIWALLMLTTRYLKIHNHIVGKFIDGEPMTVIYNGKLMVKNCLQANLSAKEIDFKLRSAGVLDITTVKRAILEQNGSITILGKYDEDVRFPVIVDGNIDMDVLSVMNKDEEWLQKELEKQGVENVKDVYMARYRHDKWDIATY